MRNTGGGIEAASTSMQIKPRFAQLSPSKTVQMDL